MHGCLDPEAYIVVVSVVAGLSWDLCTSVTQLTDLCCYLVEELLLLFGLGYLKPHCKGKGGGGQSSKSSTIVEA